MQYIVSDETMGSFKRRLNKFMEDDRVELHSGAHIGTGTSRSTGLLQFHSFSHVLIYRGDQTILSEVRNELSGLPVCVWRGRMSKVSPFRKCLLARTEEKWG